jgi:FMN-dependent NADH-azoreductase
MIKVLFIKGHPATAATSVSMQLADHFLVAYKDKNPGDTITTIDLYQDDIPLIDAEVLSAWNKLRTGHPDDVTSSERTKVQRLNTLADQFVAADKYIFAAPMWNLSYPPMVKAYVDAAVVVQGKTFGYNEQGVVALLHGKGKKALILESSGGNYTDTPMEDHTSASVYLKEMLNYIGVDDVEVITAEGMSQTPDKRDAIISAANAKATAFATSF